MEQVEAVAPAAEVLWAHPVAILALPAFIPVFVIVGTVLWIARNDRRAEAEEQGGVAVGEPGAGAVAVPASLPTPTPAAEAVPDEPRRPWRDRLPRLVIGDED